MIGIDLRNDYGADDLRALARKSRNAKQARRLMALAGVADGLSRTDAAAVHCLAGDACIAERGFDGSSDASGLGSQVQHGRAGWPDRP